MKTKVKKFRFIAKIAQKIACLTACFAFSASAAPVAKVGDTEYDTLEAAIQAAAKNGETVMLLADVTEDVTVATSVTLDLGGKTLTNAGAGKVTLTIAEGKTVTVT